MRIKKVSGTAVLNGNVVDNLTDNSTENAPSQRAVNEEFSKIAPTITQVDNLVYIKIGNIVTVTGNVLMNAQTTTFELLYTPKYNVVAPITGMFSSYTEIASYGCIVLTENSKIASVNENVATTRAIINITYETTD